MTRNKRKIDFLTLLFVATFIATVVIFSAMSSCVSRRANDANEELNGVKMKYSQCTLELTRCKRGEVDRD